MAADDLGRLAGGEEPLLHARRLDLHAAFRHQAGHLRARATSASSACTSRRRRRGGRSGPGPRSSRSTTCRRRRPATTRRVLLQQPGRAPGRSARRTRAPKRTASRRASPTQVTRVRRRSAQAAAAANPFWQQALAPGGAGLAVPVLPAHRRPVAADAGAPVGNPTPGLLANTTMETYVAGEQLHQLPLHGAHVVGQAVVGLQLHAGGSAARRRRRGAAR